MKREILQGAESLFWAFLTVLCGGAIRLLLADLEGSGTTWFTWRYVALSISLCLLAAPYLFSHEKYRNGSTALSGLGIGLLYGLGINGSGILVSDGPFWDVTALWFYASQTLNTNSQSYEFYISVAWVSVAGFFIAAVSGVVLLSIGEGVAVEIKKANSHNGTNKYRSTETVFGDAKWGRWRSFKKNVGDDHGIVLGEDYDPRKNAKYFDLDDRTTWGEGGKAELITMSPKFQSGHVLIFSSSGGGKTTAVVYPTCITYKHSLIIIDPEFEVLAATKQARLDMGRDVRVIKFGQGIDIIKLLSSITGRRDQVFAQLARLITEPTRYQTSDVSDFFRQEAETMLSGLLNHFVTSGAKNPFFEVLRVISLDEKQFKKELSIILSQKDSAPLLQMILASFVTMDSKMFGSFQSTVKQALKWAPYEELLQMVTTDPKDAPEPLGPNTDLYIQISKSDIKTYPGLIRLIIGSIAHVIDEQPDGHERIMIVDEAKQLGRMAIFETIRDTARKNDLHLIQIFQTTGQIEELYGAAGLETWNDLMAARVYSTTESAKDQESISKMVGEYTADIEGKSKSSSSRGFGIGTPTSGSAKNTSLSKVRLITPDQVRTFPNDGLIIFFRGFDPIVCGKAFSFRRDKWQKYTPFKPRRIKPN